jgi:alkylation response protein AidB-like acyl-CoA dehydrogenase
MWRYQDRYDIQMVVQSARSVARGPVARLVAAGARNTHEWTPEKAQLFDAFDESGITSVFLSPEHGGFFGGPKNLALALAAFELAWVDGGAATCSLATNLALSPIHEKGTEEQKSLYMSRACPPQPGEARKISRGAFSLTEPLPYVGVETGLLSGKMRIAEWEEGEEPILQVEKRGRFITNMAFANFVTAAVQSDDERIKGSCIIILEETDPGVFDRGSYTRKLVHQLSSTRDPVFSLRVPASRIVGGYTIKDGVIVPNYQHGDVIESVFRRTRVPVGLMTSAKLLSAVEPIIRYQRQRFRGAGAGSPGSPRYELGLQQKEDALHRLVDIWAAGEAGASFGFSTSRLLDEYDPLDRAKDEFFAKEGTETGRAQLKIFNKLQPEALELVELEAKPARTAEEEARLEQLLNKPLVQFMVRDSLINVFGPAVKLWNTANGVAMMREAVGLMGGYGITEDCPGFLGQKWMDAQLEATYEGPESVQRRQLSVTMLNEVFLAQFRHWQREMREIAVRKPGSGACTVATAMELWLKTLSYLQTAKDSSGAKLYTGNRQGVTFPMADALCWLLAARAQILDVLELEEKGPENPVLAEGLPGLVSFFTDLCHVQSGRAAGEAGRICAELVFGYQKHPAWDEKNDRGCCQQSDELISLESLIPGIDGGARAYGSVIEGDGTHRDSAGPCVCMSGLETFVRLRSKLDGCLTGCRLAKDRAAQAITKVMIPETLDYPL